VVGFISRSIYLKGKTALPNPFERKMGGIRAGLHIVKRKIFSLAENRALVSNIVPYNLYLVSKI
jgi:hypothetical protein